MAAPSLDATLQLLGEISDQLEKLGNKLEVIGAEQAEGIEMLRVLVGGHAELHAKFDAMDSRVEAAIARRAPLDAEN